MRLLVCRGTDGTTGEAGATGGASEDDIGCFCVAEVCFEVAVMVGGTEVVGGCCDVSSVV